MAYLTEEVDSFGIPLQSIGEAAPAHMWYLTVPKGDEQEILTHGLKPLHKHEYVYLNLDDAEEHAKFLNKHLDHPQAIIGIDASQVKLKHVKNANYMKGEEDRVDVGAIGKVAPNHIHHVKDVGKTRPTVKEPKTRQCAKQNRGLPPKEDTDSFGIPIVEGDLSVEDFLNKKYGESVEEHGGALPGSLMYKDREKNYKTLQGEEEIDEKLTLIDYKPYAKLVSDAYEARPSYESQYVSSWKSLAAHTEKMFKQISTKVDIQFVDEDPYQSFEEMEKEIKEKGIMRVYTGASDHPVWTPEQNWKFRAVHDYMVHLAGGHKFTLRGEVGAYNRHVKTIPPDARLALFTEVVGQVSYYQIHKSFAEQKICKLWGFDYVNVGNMDDIEYQKNFPEGKVMPSHQPELTASVDEFGVPLNEAEPKWSDFVKGEWWIDGDTGQSEFADSNVGDMGHEGIAERNILNQYSDEIFEALEEYNTANPDEPVSIVDHDNYDDDPAHQQYHDGGIPDEVGIKVMGKEKWDLFNKDTRLCYAKFYNQILAINLNFAAWKVTDKTISAIQNFLGEESYHMEGNASGDMIVEEYSTKKYVELPVQDFFNVKTPRELWQFQQKESVEKEDETLDEFGIPTPMAPRTVFR